MDLGDRVSLYYPTESLVSILVKFRDAEAQRILMGLKLCHPSILT